jgi:hypothetical protein
MHCRIFILSKRRKKPTGKICVVNAHFLSGLDKADQLQIPSRIPHPNPSNMASQIDLPTDPTHFATRGSYFYFTFLSSKVVAYSSEVEGNKLLPQDSNYLTTILVKQA